MSWELADNTHWNKNKKNMANVMHCNLRPPDVAPVVFRFNYDAHTKVEVGQPLRFYCWYFTLRVTSTFALGPWTSVVCRLWRDPTLYQILAKSNNLLTSNVCIASVSRGDQSLYQILGQSPPWILRCLNFDRSELLPTHSTPVTKFDQNRAICGGVIVISVLNLMTSSMCHLLRFSLG